MQLANVSTYLIESLMLTTVVNYDYVSQLWVFHIDFRLYSFMSNVQVIIFFCCPELFELKTSVEYCGVVTLLLASYNYTQAVASN